MDIIKEIKNVLESTANDTQPKKLIVPAVGAVGAGTGVLGYQIGKKNWRGGMKDEIQQHVSQIKDKFRIPSEIGNVITKVRKVKDVLMN